MLTWMSSLSKRPEIVRMNECTKCGAHPYDPCRLEDGVSPRVNHHTARVQLAQWIGKNAGFHSYVDARMTPYGSSGRSPECEHCDGEKSAWTRNDHLRGWVCPICDHALDAMLAEASS